MLCTRLIMHQVLLSLHIVWFRSTVLVRLSHSSRLNDVDIIRARVVRERKGKMSTQQRSCMWQDHDEYFLWTWRLGNGVFRLEWWVSGLFVQYHCSFALLHFCFSFYITNVRHIREANFSFFVPLVGIGYVALSEIGGRLRSRVRWVLRCSGFITHKLFLQNRFPFIFSHLFSSMGIRYVLFLLIIFFRLLKLVKGS